jgi:PAS domain-containing protein
MSQQNAVVERTVEEQPVTRTRRVSDEEQYHALADAMPQIVWTARPDGQLDYYNQRWFDYTGTTLDETQGARLGAAAASRRLPLSPTKSGARLCAQARHFETEYRFKRAVRWRLPLASGARRAGV